MMMRKDGPFYYENPGDSQNAITVAYDENSIIVSVAQERAMDSYNETFECSIELPREIAIALRDILNGLYPA